MKGRYSILLLILALIPSWGMAQFVYTNPLAGSRGHMPETSIALNPGYPVDPVSLRSPGLFQVQGSVSGLHDCRIVLSSDGQTIILYPLIPFASKERVTVTVAGGIRLLDRRILESTTFWFAIRSAFTEEQKSYIEYVKRNSTSGLFSHTPENPSAKITDFPSFQVTINDNPAPGSYFLADKNSYLEGDSYLAILTNDLEFEAEILNENFPNDWKMNDDCQFTYFQEANRCWYIMDTQLTVIDSLRCGNGYAFNTNGHELRLYPNGIKYLIAYDDSLVDMSDIVIGGDNNAMVYGFVLQRMDEDNNVVFQWRSWDYLEITDAVSTVPLILPEVDYCHGNSVDETADGNILISFRHLSEITKINGVTGEFIWRLGGENNMFNFMDDIAPKKFSYQHYARELPNGNLLLFNNGNFQSPQISTVKEYFIDPVAYTATLKWSYVHPLTNGFNVFGRAGGSAQRLSNGNTVICYGLVDENTGNPNFSEVDSMGNIQFEFYFDDPKEYIYRVVKHVWQTCDGIPTAVDNETVNQPVLQAYPNPASDQVEILVNGVTSGYFTLKLSNLIGEIMMSREVEMNGPFSTTVALEAWPAGLYLCEISDGNRQLVTKLVVQ